MDPIQKKVLIFGDSLVKYIPQEEKTYKVFATGGLTCKRFIGKLTRGIYDEEIINCRGIIILIGTNDLWNHQPIGIIKELGQIRGLLLSKNRRINVALGTIVPRADHLKDKAKETSNLLNKTAAEKKWKIAPVHRTFTKKGVIKEGTLGKDGLHLSTQGNALMRNYLLNYVDQNFKI